MDNFVQKHFNIFLPLFAAVFSFVLGVLVENRGDFLPDKRTPVVAACAEIITEVIPEIEEIVVTASPPAVEM